MAAKVYWLEPDGSPRPGSSQGIPTSLTHRGRYPERKSMRKRRNENVKAMQAPVSIPSRLLLCLEYLERERGVIIWI